LYFIDLDQTFSTGLFDYNLFNGIEINSKLSVINILNKKGESVLLPLCGNFEAKSAQNSSGKKKKPLVKQDLNLPFISASEFSIFSPKKMQHHCKLLHNRTANL
jgi:hypothetical protein